MPPGPGPAPGPPGVGGAAGPCGGPGAGAGAAPATPVVRVAVAVAPALTSTICAAECPWNWAKIVCLPALTNTGSAIGDLPTVTPSMLTSAPAASTITVTTPARFFASAMPFSAVAR